MNNTIKLLAQVTGDTVEIVTQDNNFRPLTTLKPSWYVRSVLDFLLGAAGIVSFIYLLWGGLQWIMAGGDKDAIEKARKKIIGALIGLTIVFSSYTILFAVRTLFNINPVEVNINSLGSNGSNSGGGNGGGNGGGGNNNLNCPCGGQPGYCAQPGAIGALSLGGSCYVCSAGSWRLEPSATCGPISCFPCP